MSTVNENTTLARSLEDVEKELASVIKELASTVKENTFLTQVLQDSVNEQVLSLRVAK